MATLAHAHPQRTVRLRGRPSFQLDETIPLRELQDCTELLTFADICKSSRTTAITPWRTNLKGADADTEALLMAAKKIAIPNNPVAV